LQLLKNSSLFTGYGVWAMPISKTNHKSQSIQGITMGLLRTHTYRWCLDSDYLIGRNYSNHFGSRITWQMVLAFSYASYTIICIILLTVCTPLYSTRSSCNIFLNIPTDGIFIILYDFIQSRTYSSLFCLVTLARQAS
jgi:hypothetical protein